MRLFLWEITQKWDYRIMVNFLGHLFCGLRRYDSVQFLPIFSYVLGMPQLSAWLQNFSGCHSGGGKVWDIILLYVDLRFEFIHFELFKHAVPSASTYKMSHDGWGLFCYLVSMTISRPCLEAVWGSSR